jgi:hypothetical protein
VFNGAGKTEENPGDCGNSASTRNATTGAEARAGFESLRGAEAPLLHGAARVRHGAAPATLHACGGAAHSRLLLAFVGTSRIVSLRNRSGGACLQLCPEHADYVVRGDHAGQLIVLIDDGHHQQVVFVEQFRDFIFADALVAQDEWFLG